MFVLAVCAIVNTFSSLLMWKNIQKNMRNTQSIILYFDLCALFFILLPMTLDNFAVLVIDPSVWGSFLNQSSLSKISDYSKLSSEVIVDCTFFVLFFNILLHITFNIVTKSFIDKPRTEIKTFPLWFYFALGFMGLICFGINYGVDFSEAGLGYRERTADSSLVLLNIFFHIFLSSSLIGIFICLQKKYYFLLIVLCLPICLIAYLTQSRALFIAAIFMLIKYFLTVYIGHLKRLLFIGIPGAMLIVSSLIALRSNVFVLLFYPVWRDSAISDLYYSIQNSQLLYNHYQGISRMLSTGIPFLSGNNSIDICVLLANSRFFEGWGTLHPSLYGWCYIDAGWVGILYAIIFGFILAATEIFYVKSLDKIAGCFIGLQFAFVPVLVRGSVQYAYATLFYPFVFFIGINLIFNWLALAGKEK